MFFRMLKKDIMERKGLNVILLVFMCLASILTVCSSIVLYANTFGVKKTMKKVNAAEVSLVTVRDLNDIKGRQDRITDWLFKQNKVEGVELGETIQFRSNAVDYLGFDEETVTLDSSFGRIEICGGELHVEVLNIKDGIVELTGRIDSITYFAEEKSEKAKRGFFEKIFR